LIRGEELHPNDDLSLHEDSPLPSDLDSQDNQTPAINHPFPVTDRESEA
jgi:hypothetical protein